MAFATVDAVVKRLEEEPTPRMLEMISEYLEEVSDAARYFAGREWNDIQVPPSVGRIVASAVARFMRNPDGYSQSRAGDETVGWQERTYDDWFTDREVERIVNAANAYKLKSFGTMQMSAGTNGHWRRKDDALYVGVHTSSAYPEKRFPMFSTNDPIKVN